MLDRGSVSPDWNSRPEARSSQLVGDEWLDQATTVVLAVPSLMLPGQFRFAPTYMNYLINPNHPAFDEVVEVGEVLDLELDERLPE